MAQKKEKEESAVHPVIAKLEKEAQKRDIVAIEGYLGSTAQGTVRLYRDLTMRMSKNLATNDILHTEQISGDRNGKVRAYVDASAPVETVFRTSAHLDNEGDATGEVCAPSGTMYCWKRIKVGDSYIIVYEPCGSCIPEFGGGGAVLG